MSKKKAPESPCKFFWGCVTIFVDTRKGSTDFFLSTDTGNSRPGDEWLVTYHSQSVKPFLEKLEWDRKKSYKNCLRQKVKTRGKTRLSENEPQTALVGTEYHKRYCLLANRPLEDDLVSVYQCITHRDFSHKARKKGQRSSEWAMDRQSNLERPKQFGDDKSPTHRYRCVLRNRVMGPRPLQTPGAVRPFRPNPLHLGKV